MAALDDLVHRVADGLAYGDLIGLHRREAEARAVADDDNALAVLRHAEVDGIQATPFHEVVQLAQLIDYHIKVPLMRECEVADVLEHEYFRL